MLKPAGGVTRGITVGSEGQSRMDSMITPFKSGSQDMTLPVISEPRSTASKSSSFNC